MAFVNEYISQEDFEKHQLKQKDDGYGIGVTQSDNWTIDRERDMFLRCMERCREEQAGQQIYAFYWKGNWTSVRISLQGGGPINGPQWCSYKLLRVHIPDSIEPHRDTYLADLKEAFTAYREFGVRSNSTEFTATFDF